MILISKYINNSFNNNRRKKYCEHNINTFEHQVLFILENFNIFNFPNTYFTYIRPNYEAKLYRLSN